MKIEKIRVFVPGGKDSVLVSVLGANIAMKKNE